MLRTFPLFLGVLVAFGNAVAQEAPPLTATAEDGVTALEPVRDPGAVAAVQQALTVLGGARAVSQITDATVQGSLEPAKESYLKAGTFVWEDAPPEFRYTVQTADGTRVFASGHGQPATEQGSSGKLLLQHMAIPMRPYHLPALVLTQELQDSRYSVKFVQDDSATKLQAIHVRISLDADPVSARVSPQDWYFSATSGLPVRVAYRQPENLHADKYIEDTEEFFDFQTVDGIMVPSRIVLYENRSIVGTAFISSVKFNTGLSSSQFDLSVGGAQ